MEMDKKTYRIYGETADIKALTNMISNTVKVIDSVLWYKDPCGYEMVYNRLITAETKSSVDYALDQLEQAVLAMISDLTAVTRETRKNPNLDTDHN